ncbi:response regulator [Paenibacillus sp. y28]|uniref:response regulator n=1 Tax=Paenibacillus sp. y28 TaxID=3129110 RepID=UPI003018D081
MFGAVIVEDEPLVLELMQFVIEEDPHFTCLGAFTNPHEALTKLPGLKPDVVFVDIEMPKMNGLELARQLNEQLDEIKIVFTTAYKQYALEAFEVYAFDYILKPVTPMVIDRIAKRLMKGRLPALPEPELPASIQCFGGFEVRDGSGQLVRWPTRKTEELFAYLLCNPGQEIGKWHLIDFMWPNSRDDRAVHNLHNTIYRLKKILKAHEIGMDIHKINEGYLLDTGQLQYDVLAFQRLGLPPGGMEPVPEQGERLCAMYKGPLLEGRDYTWKTALEEWYAKQYALLVRSLADRDMAEMAWERAERRLDEFLSIYPLHEEVNQLLMDIYARRGLLEKLRLHFERFEAAYRKDLGLELPEKLRERMLWALDSR